jgi:uncharacterized protein
VPYVDRVLAVVLYAVDPARVNHIPEVYPVHRTYLERFAQHGELLYIGPFGDPVTQGSMAIFATLEAAERFVDGDPFVTEGIAEAEIREWDALDYVS